MTSFVSDADSRTPQTEAAETHVEPEHWERSNWCLACGHFISVHKRGKCNFAVHPCDCTLFVDPVEALRAYYASQGLSVDHR